jgi:hypothetical protein
MGGERSFSFLSTLSFRSFTTDDAKLPDTGKQGAAPALQRGLNRLDQSTTLHSSGLSSRSTLVPEYNIDVIAVHGLNGHGFKTFTHPNDRMWLRDFLPNDLPGARIYTYSYDSALFFSKNTETIRDYGRRLLENIRLIRSTKEVR